MENIFRQQKELAKLIQKYSVQDGVHETLIPALYIIQMSRMAEPSHRIFKPCFCVIAQGLKEVYLAHERFEYGLTDYLIASMDLPVMGKIIKATPELPYLSIKLEFTHSQILEILNESNLMIEPKDQANRALFVGQMEPFLMNATLRLVKLLDRPDDIPFLAPLITKEVLYALLKSPYGVTLRQIAIEGSNNYRIMETLEHITRYFNHPLRIEELAETANMSIPSFHRNFKQVTGMSPIQFQKQLRLQEARRLLLSESAEASEAAFHVGYESASQFSREYSRLFGAPPKSDIKRIKEIYDTSKNIAFSAD
ncbi:AraC-like DNA-binding protein [Paenibacillus shirakamiensis]|uniref:AraC-like DNA-binding protein n=1 Tax=Paenibacillus shirakamiensis TaxID=1265935 RepID=A0ABS4JE66_9BACL|nr:AraC family transcriptional regulator [Paenibacillus shirakamiensis]MBP2000028.1 AraC-like DNA-binding protein [Paenibacillus shirakamiensis]